MKINPANNDVRRSLELAGLDQQCAYSRDGGLHMEGWQLFEEDTGCAVQPRQDGLPLITPKELERLMEGLPGLEDKSIGYRIVVPVLQQDGSLGQRTLFRVCAASRANSTQLVWVYEGKVADKEIGI